MNSRTFRRLGALGAVAAIGATGLVSAGAQADNGDADRADTTRITMELDGRNTFFKGPRSVGAGDQLEIVNNTSPKEIGPHTFSLVDKDKYPELSEKGFKECFKTGVCAQIFKAHQVDEKNESIGRKVVRSGKDGWDDGFGKRGDSWFTFAEDETFSQKVSAKAGSKLYYFCSVHPEMQGKIKVK